MFEASSSRKYQMCTKTVMDTTDPDIIFDEKGICHYYYEYKKLEKEIRLPKEIRKQKLESLVNGIKKETSNQKYNCLIGMSGGIDSSFVAWKVKELGLNPLAVHFDGGWDNEFGAHNMKVVLEKLDIDSFTLKVKTDEINDLLKAYLRSSVIDIGVYADHAIFATMYNLAAKHKIKYVLSGVNFETEFVSPKAWMYDKHDLVNLKTIHKKFGQLKKLKSYPTCGFLKYAYFNGILKMKIINLINYYDFNQSEISNKLEAEFGWQPYPRKHGESTFTTFYQNYILPTKFNIDKRKAHFSSLILSGQMTRGEALLKLKEPLYDKDEFVEDKQYVLNKLDMSEKEFDTIMKMPPKLNTAYKTDRMQKKIYWSLINLSSPIRKLFK
jgi:N-acetyl sugar amidotransferase